MPRESQYQAKLIRKLESIFPDCFVLKNDPSYRQGLPDLLILFDGFWAVLEVKRSANEPVQPNQEYYISVMDRMSFAAFIYPENEEEVLDALQSALYSRR